VRGHIPDYRAQWCMPVYTTESQVTQPTRTGSEVRD